MTTKTAAPKARKKAAPKRPAISDFTNELETIVQFLDGGPDGLGRRTFFANWLAYNVGRGRNEFGVASQIFCADPDAFVERHTRGQRTVRFA